MISPNVARNLRGGATTLGSSILSSGTNALAGLVAAGYLNASAYGEFSLAFLLAVTFSIIVSAYTGEVALSGHAPLTSEGAIDGWHVYRLAIRIAVPIPIALLCLVVTLRLFGFEGSVVTVLLATLLAIPPITIHAVARSMAFARREPATALLLDSVWAALLFGGLLAASLLHVHMTPVTFACVWAVPAAIAVCVGPDRRYMFRRGPKDTYQSWPHRFGAGLAYNAGMNAGSRYAVAIVAGAVVGLAALGGLRFTQTAFGLSTIFFTAARASLLPVFVAARRPPRVQARQLFGVSAALSLIPLAGLLFFWGFEDLIASLIDEEILDQALVVLVPVAVASIASAFTQGPQIGLRVYGAASGIVRARTIQTLATLGIGFGGLFVGGISGAAWGLAIGNALGASAWWYQYIADLRRR